MSSCIRNAPYLQLPPPLNNNNVNRVNANHSQPGISSLSVAFLVDEHGLENQNEEFNSVDEKKVEKPKVNPGEESTDFDPLIRMKRDRCTGAANLKLITGMSEILDPVIQSSEYKDAIMREVSQPAADHLQSVKREEDVEVEKRMPNALWGQHGNKVTDAMDPKVPLRKGSRESDEEFAKRVRKHNYLSLAQEYVAQKNATANRHQQHHTVTRAEKDVEDPGEGWVRYVRPVLEALPANAAANSDGWRRRVSQGPSSGARNKPDQGKVPVGKSSGSGSLRRVSTSSEGQCGSPDPLASFDVYNIETAMPAIDWAAVEEHLARAALEEKASQRQILVVHSWKYYINSRHRNDREEIRRKLAMGPDNEDYYGGERIGKRPSLQARLQSGMNLQICFMNETAVDQDVGESNVGDVPPPPAKPIHKSTSQDEQVKAETPIPAAINNVAAVKVTVTSSADEPTDFLSRQAKLQAEARLALAQAKQMARMQIEVEKQRKKKSPIAEMVGIPFPDCRRKLSRHVLSDMNVAQLQVIVNDLHSQIESLNEELVHLLLERDDLHMEQDSMLVDIEDLTRYLGAKDEALRETRGKLVAATPPHPLLAKYRFKKSK